MVRLSGRVSEVKTVASSKALLPIEVRPVPKLIEVSAVAFWNALFPIVVMLLGRVRDVKAVAFWKALADTEVTPSVITADPAHEDELVTMFEAIV